MTGWELLRRSEVSSGMVCQVHGQRPPIDQLLKEGYLYVVCKHCITEYCDIGWAKRVRETGERGSSESDNAKDGH